MIEALKQAGQGWSLIFSGKPGWEKHFRLDAEGMNTGFTVYGVAVLVALMLTFLRAGFPPPGVLLILLVGHLAPLVALVVVTSLAKRLFGFGASTGNFIVPGLYLIALMKVVEGVTVLAGVPMAGAITAVTGVLGFRLARANGLETGPAAGYGVALFALLAGLPVGLYMLVSAF